MTSANWTEYTRLMSKYNCPVKFLYASLKAVTFIRDAHDKQVLHWQAYAWVTSAALTLLELTGLVLNAWVSYSFNGIYDWSFKSIILTWMFDGVISKTGIIYNDIFYVATTLTSLKIFMYRIITFRNRNLEIFISYLFCLLASPFVLL